MKLNVASIVNLLNALQSLLSSIGLFAKQVKSNDKPALPEDKQQ